MEVNDKNLEVGQEGSWWSSMDSTPKLVGDGPVSHLQYKIHPNTTDFAMIANKIAERSHLVSASTM